MLKSRSNSGDNVLNRISNQRAAFDISVFPSIFPFGNIGKISWLALLDRMKIRLEDSGIKLALPSESARGASYLQLYVEYILALGRRRGCSRP